MATPAKLNPKVVGKRVAEHRERLKLSRPELAARLSVDRTHVWRIEAGRTLPSLPLLDRLARLFGVTLDDLRTRKQGGQRVVREASGPRLQQRGTQN
jgi:transcriptional regulator with XRE-family HTH domain